LLLQLQRKKEEIQVMGEMTEVEMDWNQNPSRSPNQNRSLILTQDRD
jgi:hypothetical protein